MGAQQLRIESKRRTKAIAVNSLEDFQYEEGAEIDPRIVVEEATVSLYCLDHEHRRAIFVRTVPEVDLSAAPFFYQAQYAAAQQLIAISYDTLHQLASDVSIEAQRIILVYSPGRCGSTLVSHALNQGSGVFSFAEPDVHSQLTAIREPDGSNGAEVSDLVRDCTKVMCAAARSGGALAWAFKFRSYAMDLADLLFHHFPEARVVFVYRNIVGWAASSVRAFGMFEPQNLASSPQSQRLLSRLFPLIRKYSETHTTTIPTMELLVCRWVSAMQGCLDLQQQGVPMFCARYEDLREAPRTVLDAMLDYCGLSVEDTALLDRVVAQDSQAGTSLAQARQSNSVLMPDHVADLHRLLRSYAPNLTGDL